MFTGTPDLHSLDASGTSKLSQAYVPLDAAECPAGAENQ